jgi:hypothetical protein
VKSGTQRANVKMRGTHSKVLSCGCCDAVNFKRTESRQQLDKQIPALLADDYTREEFMADICTEDEPCEICVSARAAP